MKKRWRIEQKRRDVRPIILQNPTHLRSSPRRDIVAIVVELAGDPFTRRDLSIHEYGLRERLKAIAGAGSLQLSCSGPDFKINLKKEEKK